MDPVKIPGWTLHYKGHCISVDSDHHGERIATWTPDQGLVGFPFWHERAMMNIEEAAQKMWDSRTEVERQFGWCKPRDPARIPELLRELRILWQKAPDQRLGQLIRNVLIIGDRLGWIEDHVLLERIRDKQKEWGSKDAT